MSSDTLPFNRLQLLWAKIGRGPNDSYDQRHPLLCHLVDVGSVAYLLWTEVLREALKKRIAAALNLSDTDETGRWLAFWAASHDLGKASPGFQAKRQDAVGPLSQAGFDFSRADAHPHGFVSTAALESLLRTIVNDGPTIHRS